MNLMPRHHAGPLTAPIDSDVGNASNHSVTMNLGTGAPATSGGALQSGKTVTIRYLTEVNSAAVGDLITNCGAVFTVSIDEGATFVSESSGSVRVNADAVIAKTASPTRIPEGGMMTYTITVTNASADPIAWFDVVDRYDRSRFSFVSATLNMLGVADMPVIPIAVSAGVYRYHVDAVPLNPGGTATLTTQMFAAPGTPECLYNDAAQLIYDSPKGPVAPPVPVGTVPYPVRKVGDRQAVSPGQAVVYAVTYVNNTGGPIDNLTLVDAHDSGCFAFVSAQMNLDGAIFPATPRLRSGQNLFDVPGTIPPKGTAVLTVTLLASAGIPPGDHRGAAWAEYADSARSPAPPAPIDADAAAKTADKSVLLPGEDIVYSIQFANTTGADITDLQLIDSHDSTHFGFAAASCSVNGISASINPLIVVGGQYTFAIPGVVPAGAIVTLAITMYVADNAPAGTYNATAWAQYDSTVTPPSALVPVIINPIERVADRGMVAPGGRVTHAITFRNKTGEEMSGAVIYDEYDSGHFQFVSSRLTVGGVFVEASTIAQGDRFVTAIPVAVPDGATVTLTWVLSVAQGTPSGRYRDAAWLVYGAAIRQ